MPRNLEFSSSIGVEPDFVIAAVPQKIAVGLAFDFLYHFRNFHKLHPFAFDNRIIYVNITYVNRAK